MFYFEPQILLTAGVRGLAVSEWGLQILKYDDDFKLHLSH